MIKNLLKDIYARGGQMPQQASATPTAVVPHQEWLDWLLDRTFQLMHNVEQDNFDADRYRSEPPNAFFFDRHAAYFKLLLKHAEHFYATRQLLADETSRTLFDQLILFRILGHLHVRLPFNVPENRGQNAIVEAWRVDDSEDSGLFGKLQIFVTPPTPTAIRVKCWKENVTTTFLQRQYYFSRDGVTIAPMRGDHVVDAGGCFGDTALSFAAAVGEAGRVYSFDPVPKHCAIIQENLDMNPTLAPLISVHELGLAADERIGRGLSGAEDMINPGATAFSDSISTTTIDKLVEQGIISRVDFIKMDIEGSELGALKGARNVLCEQRPRLAISLYHRPEDFFVIPLWINELQCGYRFYLEHYSIHHEETVLFAVA